MDMGKFAKACVKAQLAVGGCVRLLRDERGQGTTEYAILVGVLAVIAMIAIAAFRDNIQNLWNAITSGVNSL